MNGVVPERVDCHTHTYLSGHGVGTVDEVVSAAVNCGLSTVCLTEHISLPASLDPLNHVSIPAQQIPAYFEAINEARDRYPHIEIITGFECDWYAGCEQTIVKYRGEATFLIGSIHFLRDMPIDFDEDIRIWEELGRDKLWSEYFEEWRSMVSIGIPFNTIGHADLPKKFGWIPTYDLSSEYASCAEVAQQAGVHVEINTSGVWKTSYGELYPAMGFLKELCRAGVPITVGSDAHNPKQVGNSIELAYKAAWDAGYRSFDVPTLDGSFRTVSLT